MATAKTRTLVQAVTSFAGPDGLQVDQGSLWWSDDPVVKDRPTLFRPATPERDT